MVDVGCIDVGGTTVKSGVLVDGSRLLRRTATPSPTTQETDGTDVLDLVAELVDDLATHGDVAAVGVVVPGIVDDAAGIGVHSANLGWRDVPFRDAIARRVRLPVAFGHDVRAGALAEARLGGGRGHRDVMFVPVGTGIAAGLVLAGRPYDGGGWAGEIGHVDVGHDEPCECGLTGCLEALSSGAAIARRFIARAGREVAGADEVAVLARAGHPVAAAVWTEAVDALAYALAWSVGLLAPQVIVVGGGLALAGDQLLVPLRANMAARLSFQRVPPLRVAELGDRAGCIGAGLLAMDLLESTP